jgi:hypothetical protein
MPTVRTWSTKFEMRSPRYTTRLSDLPVIGATLGALHTDAIIPAVAGAA